MVRLMRVAGVLLWGLAAHAATLEYLSTDDMIARSTAIVRARVAGSSARVHGPVVYTHFAVQVMERFKGTVGNGLEVVVPGGSADGLRQTFSGAPALASGSEYLLFLWTGPSGLTHVIGLSQGVLTLSKESGGEEIASRSASAEPMVDGRTGRVVTDRPVRIRLSELRSRVTAAERVGGATQ